MATSRRRSWAAGHRRRSSPLATQAAQEKAECLAQAAGLRLGALDSLTEDASYDAGYAVNAMTDMAKGESFATGIRAGGVSVSASVTAVYEAEK